MKVYEKIYNKIHTIKWIKWINTIKWIKLKNSEVCCTFKQDTQYWMTIMYMFLFGEKSFCMDFAHTWCSFCLFYASPEVDALNQPCKKFLDVIIRHGLYPNFWDGLEHSCSLSDVWKTYKYIHHDKYVFVVLLNYNLKLLVFRK